MPSEYVDSRETQDLVGHPGYLTTGNNHGASNATTTDRTQPPISLAQVAIMYDSNRPHPLLAQVSLTVSPFISLPSAVTLPYTYKSIASTLPPSVLAGTGDPDAKPRYVVSSTGGHAAHPDEILASCQSLEAHLQKTVADAEKTIKDWEDSIRQRELAEKRRVAPGWLDREEKILQPQLVHPSSGNHSEDASPSILDSRTQEQESQPMPTIAPRDEGEELDRAFGGLQMK